jgi:histone-lysine N-methyltransferase SETD3
MEALTSWLAAGGAHLDRLAIRERAGHRGVFATRAIAEGTVIVRLPRPLLVTREQVRVSSLGRQLRDANLELSSSHALLAGWLAVERRNPRSPFHPYFDALPRAFDGFPLHASAEHRALLAGSLTGAMLDELRADLDADFAKLARVRLFGGVLRDELIWARLCVGSRVFAVTIDGLDTTALVPFADLLNHDPGRHTRWQYDQEAEAFTITALRDHAPGEEIYDSYGSKPSWRLLVQYGFVVDDNADDEAELLGVRVARSTDHAGAQELLATLAKQHAGDERAIRRALAHGARAALARFSTTIGEDDELLADPACPARDFIRARRSEKAVLHTWLDLATRQDAD